MQCSNCGKYFKPEPKHVVFSVFDRYYIEIRYPEIGDSSLRCLHPLFVRLIQNIGNGQNIEKYRDFNFYIHDRDMEFECPHCHATNKTDFVLSLPDDFFLFIKAYINFEIDSILLKALGIPAQDVGIDTLDLKQL